MKSTLLKVTLLAGTFLATSVQDGPGRPQARRPTPTYR